MELLLIIAGVGASMMLCASRGWSLTSKIMVQACDILAEIGVNNTDMSRGLKPSAYKFTYGPQKYIAVVLLAIVAGGAFAWIKDGHTIGGCIVLGVILLCNIWPGIFHTLQYGVYQAFGGRDDIGESVGIESPDELYYAQGLNMMGVNRRDDPAVADIPQELVIAVGQGCMMYVYGIMLGRFGGIVSAVVLAFTYFFVLE